MLRSFGHFGTAFRARRAQNLRFREELKTIVSLGAHSFICQSGCTLLSVHLFH